MDNKKIFLNTLAQTNPNPILIEVDYAEGIFIYDKEGKKFYAQHELVRLAIPRRTYTQSHIDYVVEVFDKIKSNRSNIRGLKIVSESNTLRHFSAKLERK